mmetsp:Transcript_37553/g.106050  ORF Transcript_37553/g.106050 Transcript_37553/m.106050 type:complete len:239 (+) Transcript_37553:51-767(+)
MNSPEPILDVVRGLSTIASFGIVVTHIKQVWDEIFTGRCEFCKGSGIITCRQCHGTKTLRREPAQLSVLDSSYYDPPGSTYPCNYCPSVSKYDFDFEAEDNELEAYIIQDNLKAVMSAKPRPHQMPVLAGTQRCPQCLGNPLIIRHTPNLRKVLNLEVPLFRKVALGLGTYSYGVPGASMRRFEEYPGPPSSPIPLLSYKRPEKEKKKEGDDTMSAKDQLTLDDYILPYVDDSDSDED